MKFTRRFTPRPIWAAALPLAVAGVAHAQTTTFMSATASSKLGSNATTTYSQVYNPPTSTTNPVDVLSFQSDAAGDGIGLHTYGSTSGDFGSRSSGQGVYQESGTFLIRTVYQNPFTTPQNVTFNFYITPGYIQNYAPAAAGSDSVSSGISFLITRDGTTKFSSSAKLTTKASGTVFTQTGTNLYTAGPAVFSSQPTNYSVAGGQRSIDLGVLSGGASLTLEYTISTFAYGNFATRTFNVPAQTFTRPDQLVEFCGIVAAATFQAEAVVAPGNGCNQFTIAGQNDNVSAHEVSAPGSSYASSGDPYAFDGNGRIYGLNDGNANLSSADPYGISFTPTAAALATPEPATIALTMTGLGMIGLVARRRRRA